MLAIPINIAKKLGSKDSDFSAEDVALLVRQGNYLVDNELLGIMENAILSGVNIPPESISGDVLAAFVKAGKSEIILRPIRLLSVEERQGFVSRLTSGEDLIIYARKHGVEPLIDFVIETIQPKEFGRVFYRTVKDHYDGKDYRHISSLDEALENGHFSIARKILKFSGEYSYRGHSALYHGLKNGNAEFVDWLFAELSPDDKITAITQNSNLIFRMAVRYQGIAGATKIIEIITSTRPEAAQTIIQSLLTDGSKDRYNEKSAYAVFYECSAAGNEESFRYLYSLADDVTKKGLAGTVVTASNSSYKLDLLSIAANKSMPLFKFILELYPEEQGTDLAKACCLAVSKNRDSRFDFVPFKSALERGDVAFIRYYFAIITDPMERRAFVGGKNSEEFNKNFWLGEDQEKRLLSTSDECFAVIEENLRGEDWYEITRRIIRIEYYDRISSEQAQDRLIRMYEHLTQAQFHEAMLSNGHTQYDLAETAFFGGYPKLWEYIAGRLPDQIRSNIITGFHTDISSYNKEKRCLPNLQRAANVSIEKVAAVRFEVSEDVFANGLRAGDFNAQNPYQFFRYLRGPAILRYALSQLPEDERVVAITQEGNFANNISGICNLHNIRELRQTLTKSDAKYATSTDREVAAILAERTIIMLEALPETARIKLLEKHAESSFKHALTDAKDENSAGAYMLEVYERFLPRETLHRMIKRNNYEVLTEVLPADRGEIAITGLKFIEKILTPGEIEEYAQSWNCSAIKKALSSQEGNFALYLLYRLPDADRAKAVARLPEEWQQSFNQCKSKHEVCQKLGKPSALIWFMLTRHNPPSPKLATNTVYGYSLKVYNQILPVIRVYTEMENRRSDRTPEQMDELAIEASHKLAVLFSSAEEVFRYLESCATEHLPESHQPVHDATLFKVPQNGIWNITQWKDLILKFGPRFTKHLANAAKIEAYLKEENIDFPKSLTELNELISRVGGMFLYPRGKENPELANICVEIGIAEEDFNTALEIIKQRLPVASKLPDVLIDGARLMLNDGRQMTNDEHISNYYMQKLPDGDPRGLFLGEYVDCCQSIGSAAPACAIHGFTSENGGFYVWKKKTRGKITAEDPIIAETWAWIGKKGNIVFDSLEALGQRGNGFYQPFLERFNFIAKQQNFPGVNVGVGGKTPALDYPVAQEADSPLDGQGYDSSTQYVVSKLISVEVSAVMERVA